MSLFPLKSISNKPFHMKNMIYAEVALIILFSILVKIFATAYMSFATLAYGFMLLGVLNRKTSKIHAKFMGSAIFIDLSIVLVLELKRDAVQKALEFSLTFFQQLHIGMSTLALLFYFPIVYLGIKALRTGLTHLERKIHISLGIIAFVFRTIGFILMFSMLK
ncbi:hypothetical protein [Silvanigrella aquatica]|uniref:Uncharacterized protein n=1 Tax=Silvanigrella aquatica TaxID=1915309 RepID=A0A1L4CYV5_9BACT|nr:hypothetical protein [Silvanigrella aquatica]APJ03128.1 hypothetical protein AXG55_04085 [Silvanigrella aquatica]